MGGIISPMQLLLQLPIVIKTLTSTATATSAIVIHHHMHQPQQQQQKQSKSSFAHTKQKIGQKNLKNYYSSVMKMVIVWYQIVIHKILRWLSGQNDNVININ